MKDQSKCSPTESISQNLNRLTNQKFHLLNDKKVPLFLHYGFEGRIIILHKNPYRWRLQNDAKGMEIFG